MTTAAPTLPTPATKAPAGLVVVYDGECPFCRASAAFLTRHRLVPDGSCRPASSFEGALARRLEAAGIRNEMAVLDPETGEVRAGAPGLLWAMENGRGRGFARFLSRRPILSLVSAAYRLVSYNRRVLAPPAPRPVACACEPDDRPFLRWTLVAILVGFSLLVVAAFGAMFARELKHLPLVGPYASVLLVIVPGWLVPALFSFAQPREVRARYLAHLSVTAAAGAAVLVPAILLSIPLSGQVGGVIARAALALAAAVACALMLGMQERRVGYLGLPRWWVLLWVVSLLVTTPLLARWLYAH